MATPLVLPWVIGILQFFLIPFVRTVFYSFNTLTIDRQQGFVTTFDGFAITGRC